MVGLLNDAAVEMWIRQDAADVEECGNRPLTLRDFARRAGQIAAASELISKHAGAFSTPLNQTTLRIVQIAKGVQHLNRMTLNLQNLITRMEPERSAEGSHQTKKSRSLPAILTSPSPAVLHDAVPSAGALS